MLARPAAEAAVDIKKFGNALMIAGAAGIVGALVWWSSFYSSISRSPIARELARLTGNPDAGLYDVLSCLYSSSGLCGAVSTLAALAGRTVYEPMLFWFGVACLLLGMLVRYAAKPSKMS
jgi:hypothetical protein